MTPEEACGILRDSGCFDFLREPARAAVGEIVGACPEGAALLSDQASQDLENGFCARMEMVYMHPLLTKLIEADPALRLAPALASREKWTDAAVRTRALLGPEFGVALAGEYPLIRAYTSRIRQNYIDSQAELLRRVAAYEGALSDGLFDGRPVGRIRSLSGDLGDLHRHGRSVRRIVTDAGAFYCKPHDCRFEALYHELVTSLFSDFTLSPAVICGEGFGFEEEMKPREMESIGQAEDYFHNLGMLLALFHAMGSTDMHGENVMACGVRPAAIDLETLVRGKVSPSAMSASSRQTPLNPVEIDLDLSVAGIGMLPNTILRGVFMSALHKGFPNGVSLPRWRGEEMDIIGREDIFLRGFRAGYDRVLASRDRLREMLREAGGMPVRYVVRNTTYYFVMRLQLFRAEAMASEENRERALRRLEVPFTQANLPIHRGMLDYETRCLSEGDIPYFCTAVDGHALCGENTEHVLQAGYWRKSPAEVMRDRLERLSPRERDFEAAYIRTRLAHAPLPEQKGVECPELPQTGMTAEEARALCGRLLRALEDDALHTSCGATIWHSGMLDIEKEPTCGYATQCADAALYCAAILAEPSLSALHGDARRIAGQCLEQMESFAQRLEAESEGFLRSALPLGLDFGFGGILLAVAAAERAGMAGAGELKDRCLRIVRQNRLYRDRLKPGREAGLLLALKALGEGCEPLTGCAEALCGLDPSDAPMQEALRGAALSEAFRASGEDRFARASEACFRRVLEAFLPHIHGWADKKPVVGWLARSGGQEGGILLCALLAGDSGEARQVRDLALGSLAQKRQLSRGDALFDGNALSVLGLVRSAEALDRRGDLEQAGRLLSAMASRREGNGCFIISPPGTRSFFDVSVSRGTLGVGYAALAYLGAWRQFK